MVDVDKANKEFTKDALDMSKYKVYTSLMDEVFKKYGFQRAVSYMSTDPWAPGDHYIVRKEKTKFLFIPTTKDIAVAKIKVEPRFVGNSFNSDYGNTPIIQIIDKNDKKLVEAVGEFANSFKKTFNYEFKVE